MSSRPRPPRPADPLAYFAVLTALYAVGPIIYARMAFASGRGSLPHRLPVGTLILGFALTFVWSAVRLAVRVPYNGVVVSTVVTAAAYYTAGLILLPVAIFWIPGVYMIDCELSEFVTGMLEENSIISLGLAAIASLIALVSLGIARFWHARAQRW